MLARSLDVIMRQRVALYCDRNCDDADVAILLDVEAVQGAVVIAVAAVIVLSVFTEMNMIKIE